MEISASTETMDIINDILNSNLRPIEKMLLTIEWCLREQKPDELYETKLVTLQGKAETLIKKQMTSDLRRKAFKEATEIFKIEDKTKLLSILTALSYYSYIINEVAYDHDIRRELLSKLPELGFSPSKVHDLNIKWTKVIGSSEELFNKIFRK